MTTLRPAWLIGGLAASVALTALLWMLGIPGFALFLLFPFVFAWRGPWRPEQRRCPGCQRAWPRSMRHCPDDGTKLQ